MKKEEILTGFVAGLLCVGVSSLVVQSRPGNPTLYQQTYPSQSGASSQSTHSTIESLPNGNYRFCSEPSASDGSEAGMCFRFQKTDDRVVGAYQPANSAQASLCVTGRVSRNVINGEATDFSSPTSELIELRPELQGAKLVNWDAAGTTDYLEVAAGEAMDQETPDATTTAQTGKIRFQQASLDLSSFHPYSTGSIAPPPVVMPVKR